MYEYLLFFHILGMAMWLGAGFALNVLMARGNSGKNPALGPALGPEMEFFGKAVFAPLTLFVGATDAWLVAETNTAWTEPYVLVGLAAFAISMLMGPLWMGRNSAKLGATIAEHGPTHADVAKYRARLKGGAIFLLLVLVVTTYFMVVKPG
ncbi:MAG: DUF2269 family protein [Actinomycetota bacterium]